MLMTAIVPLSATNEMDCWDNRPFINKWPEFHGNKTIKCEQTTRTIKKKSKRIRTLFTTDQINRLEEEFSRHPYIDAFKRAALSKSTKIGERQIKIWFQNRRMKKKRELSESSSDCETSSMSSAVVTSSVDGEGSVIPQQLAMGANSVHDPAYNIEVTYPAADDQYTYQPQQYPTYQTMQYPDEMCPYPTEYYPTSYESSSYGIPDNCYNQSYIASASGWYGNDSLNVNEFQNYGYFWPQ